ncbi:MAG: hypothetical protein M1503_11125, partial [Thaumarchaeota archaeon]|nr:hypothetical protein [Nitrososphaerota archaeon]
SEIEEVYLPFDTRKILGVPPSVAITKTSGLAGIVFWINNHLRLDNGEKVQKTDPRLKEIYNWVMDQYENKGRIIPISDVEMMDMTAKHLPDLYKKHIKKHTS